MAGLVVDAASAMEARKPWLPGEYHVTLTNSRVKDASGPDKFQQLILEFTAQQDEGDYAGKKCFRSLSAKPEAIPFMVDAAVELGADPDDVTQNRVDFEQVFQELRGVECWIQTSINTYTRPGSSEPDQRTSVDKILSAPTA